MEQGEFLVDWLYQTTYDLEGHNKVPFIVSL